MMPKQQQQQLRQGQKQTKQQQQQQHHQNISSSTSRFSNPTTTRNDTTTTTTKSSRTNSGVACCRYHSSWKWILLLILVIIYACLLLGLQIAQHRQIHQLVEFSSLVQEEFFLRSPSGSTTSTTRTRTMNSLVQEQHLSSSIRHQHKPNNETTTTSRMDSSLSISSAYNSNNIHSIPLSSSSLSFSSSSTLSSSWLQEYLHWHQQQRAQLNATNWKQFKYIVLQCTILDGAECSKYGIINLKSIPLFLLMGYWAQRILFIHWDALDSTTSTNKQQQQHRPLTHYMLPPVDGFDWRMPSFLIHQENVGFAPRPMTSAKQVRQAMTTSIAAASTSNKTKLDTSSSLIPLQQKPSWNFVFTVAGGARLFDQYKPSSSPSYEQLYASAFRLLFTPTIRLQRRIQQQLHLQQQLQQLADVSLKPGQYIGVYLSRRAVENGGDVDANTSLTLVQQAMDCANQFLMVPNNHRHSNSMTPNNNHPPVVVVASDPILRKQAQQLSAAVPQYHVVNNTTRKNTPQIVVATHRVTYKKNEDHLNQLENVDKPSDETNDEEDDDNDDEYENALIDLWLLGQSQCVLHDDARGIGLLASWISYNVSCAVKLTNNMDKNNLVDPDYTMCKRVVTSGLIGAANQQQQQQLDHPLSTRIRDNQNSSSFALFAPPMMTENGQDDHKTTTAVSRTSNLALSFRPFTTAWYMYSEVADDDHVAPVTFAPPLEPLVIDNNHGQHHNSAAATTTAIEHNLWDASTILPQWMKEYFHWHRAQRAQINRNNCKNFKYLILQCMKRDRRCGGTADRLKAVPMVILVAALTQRILLIHWEIPKPLEAFLLPPVGGIDWRVPQYLKLKLFQIPRPVRVFTRDNQLLNLINNTDNIFKDQPTWHLKYQSFHSGALFYNENKPMESPTFDAIYHDAWRVMFTPAPPIATMVEDLMEQWQLIPGEYAAVHIRAQYARVERTKACTMLLTRNALRCASMLFPGGPIFAASDDLNATIEAWAYGKKRHTKIVARNGTITPLHLDKASNPELRYASEYYDTFVDLYLMAMSRCVTYNKGGFGHWASLISFNSSCAFRHQFNEQYTNCSWTIPSHDRNRLTKKFQRPIFAPPMMPDRTW